MNNFLFNDSIGKHLGLSETILYKEYNIWPDLVDILSIDNIFIHTDKAQGIIFKSKRSGITQNLTMDVDPGYKYTEKFRSGNMWYMMESKDVISSIFSKLKNEKGNLVFFNGQPLSFKEIWKF